jgi:thymidylate synthase (FAD)
MIQIDVLDKGYVKLVDSMGGDYSILRAARVSHDHDRDAISTMLNERDVKLLNYLWDHHHTTPFEAVTVTFEIKAPIFVFRQWHRHRTQSYNEMSARYTELPEEFYMPTPEAVGTQDTKNKQARTTGENIDLTKVQLELDSYKIGCEEAFVNYHYLLESGWPRELARMILPVSTYSRMYTTMNLLNCFRFLTLRADSHAQHEIRVYADAMVKLLYDGVAPYAVDAWRRTHEDPSRRS